MARNKHPEATVQKIVSTAAKLFVQQGYDNTSIQDIIGRLGGLSKGAIYHHFRSKEEILDAVTDFISEETVRRLESIVGDAALNGLQKLRKLLDSAVLNPGQEQVFALSVDLMENPHMLAVTLRSTVEESARNYLLPIVQQGVADGSLAGIEYPQEFAESFLLLLNIWLNPMVYPATPEEVERKCRFMQFYLKSLGIQEVLISEEAIQKLKEYTALHGEKLAKPAGR